MAESPSSSVMQAEEQSCAADPCDTEDPRTAEKMAESPSSSVMQAEEQSCAADPCDTEDPRTAEKMAESPSSSVMQAEEQSCAADPCDTEDPRTAEKMAESPSSSVMQDRQCIPRLRRTKSLFLEMKGQIDFDSDELFDPTSDDSGEEYIPKSDPQEDVNVALSDLEKRLCQHFRRLEIRGKRGRKVPVLLTPAMQQALDLLIRKRKECEILPENTYLFARPSSLMCYRGSDSLRYFAKVCGARSPESLTSTKLRKQTGTLSQVLNLTNTELDQLADFLGHDIRVHRQFYRLPEGTLQLAKISKVLMALEQGRLAEFKGKSLDDINIDPEENVHLDSDHERDPDAPCDPEAAYESDSLENPVTTENETTGPDVSIPQKDTVTQTHPNKSLKSLKGRQHSKRMWEKEEVAAVERHMMSFITSCRVPGKADCVKCLNVEKTALKNRNWLAIKFYVKNRITALKKKL
ncbi:hypothetical protein D5F01_LYC06258 [Larimichthys crocea]|uniref:Uncharacterized protein n=1 Tax=Larimichthys crocea TaxID=215358 RepID=A0A6G0IVR1_LARCR|nr:hypothetical protein D5F01_LYC06258 [Larimichthys crocea]